MSATAFLDVRDISVVFGGLKAVNGLSFQVEQGRIHALIGPNGAGKSTTFNCISRFYTPSSGSVSFEGRELTRVAPHRMASLGIARTFQNLELFAEMLQFRQSNMLEWIIIALFLLETINLFWH